MTEENTEILRGGSQFGPYRLKRLLGSGGMGQVFEAEDTGMDRVVALKLISATYSGDPEFKKRLQREARIAGRLREPHVVPVHEAGEIDGQLFVDMRLIDGTDLATVLQRSGPLDPARAVAVVRQIASALDAAHAAGVIHRDVKPGNILLCEDDFAYLVDFGIANAVTEEKLTHMGDVLGTWSYMAPERFLGDDTRVSSSVDVYALACVLYEMLTGSPPYGGDRVSLMGAHMTGPIPRPSRRRPDIPAGLDEVIAHGMAKDPEDRYRSANELAHTAAAAVGGAGYVPGSAITTPVAPAGPVSTAVPQGPHYAPTVPPSGPPPPQWPQQSTPPPPQWPQQWAPPPTPPPATIPTTKRRRRWILIAAAVVLVVAVAGGFGIWGLIGDKHTQVQSQGSTPAVDLSKLDVGHYGTKPRTLPGPTTEQEGRFLAAFGLAEGIANPYEVDPKLDHLYGAATPDPKVAAAEISGTSTPIVQPVLEKYGMVSAYVVQGLSTPLTDFIRTKSGDVLIVLLSSFPNPDAAARAAPEMDAADFAVNPDNKHLTIPGYPQAKAHHRPGFASVAATMARGSLVASIFTSESNAPDLNYLTQRVQRAFDKQGPLMDHLISATGVGLTFLPLDPDHMLSRSFIEGEPPTISEQYGSIGPRATAFCATAGAVRARLFEQAGVDRCAFTPSGTLLRAQDDAAANALLPKLIQVDTEGVDHDVASPDAITNARCYESKQEIWSDDPNARFVCGVSFGRYVAWVSSNEEKDARQRGAAQYAILVNSA